MSVDLKYLLFSTVLCLVQVLITALGAISQVGLLALIGNREGFPELTGWAGRARRAHLNILENLVPFAALVLIAAVAGKANAMTALGATIFFWARLAYVPVYVAGILWLRTVVWFVSVIGMVLIAYALLKAI
jgi:uncharacterized MAPEG superfamily protein